MAKVIIHDNGKGGAAVTTPTPEFIRKHGGEDAAISALLAKRFDGVATQVVEQSEVPSDRTFREAWEVGEGVEVSMPKARAIHMQRIRAERNGRFKALDAEFAKQDALARYGNDTNAATKAAEAEAKRQALRDIPQRVQPGVDAATTPEELKAVTIDYVPPR